MNIISNKIVFILTLGAVSGFPNPQLSAAENFLVAPNILVSKYSSEGKDIANKIAELFRKEQRPIQTDFPSNQDFQTTKITSSNIGTSINFNFNVAIDVSNGKISRIRLPHGDLLILFVAADNNGRVNINPGNFREFLANTVGATHMAKIMGNRKGNSRGLVFMSWSKPTDFSKSETNTLHKNVNVDALGMPKKNRNEEFAQRHTRVKSSSARAPLRVISKST